METMIAYCGIICTKCPVYLATQADDDKAREAVAQRWSTQYGLHIKPRDAICDGCLKMDGRLFSHCRVCGIRACGMEKKVSTCAACADYACAQLKAFHSVAPHAGRMLEKLRAE
ncbi:MAG TPA: DUF3795 domain-containing protein [Smithella sp.]|nr:DUF3795 domain-containing protein [Smithella sp.]